MTRATVISATLGAVVLAAIPAAAVQEHARTPHRHPEAEKLVNPMERTPASIKAGGAVYAKACANCHGPYGLANTKLAQGMAAYGARPSNLTDAEWIHGSTDGEIFAVIRDGVGPDFHMPTFGGTLSDDEMWQLVVYIRSIGF
jgi:mono/diheme cytochrome c family protein